MLMSTQFDFVSVVKKPNIYFDGLSISRTIQFKNGIKKTYQLTSVDTLSKD